jgi:integrase/recombinase XerD
METFSLSGITATPIIDTRREKGKPVTDTTKSKDESFYPIKYRVTFMRKQVYYSSGIDLSLKEWDFLPDTKKKSLIENREMIQAGFDRIKEHIKDLVKADGFTIEKLNTRLSRGMKNSVISALYDKAITLKAAGRIGTSEWYFYSAKSIEKFTDKDLKFSEITKDWLTRYEANLLENGKSYTTISMHIRALQAIVNEGKEQGIITPAQYPFGKGKYEIPTGVGRKMALTLAQINEVLKYTLLSETEKRCRDLWFFSYLCNGINMNDLLRLKYANIYEGEIRFYRQKTIKKTKEKRDIAAILLPEVKQIIDKWGNPDRKPENFIFPFLSEGLTPVDEKRIVKNVTRLINKKMGEIGKALEYGNISTYTARHSFATVLKRSGANIAFISESLGHTDLKTTENYLASFEKEERIKNAALLTNFKQ